MRISGTKTEEESGEGSKSREPKGSMLSCETITTVLAQDTIGPGELAAFYTHLNQCATHRQQTFEYWRNRARKKEPTELEKVGRPESLPDWLKEQPDPTICEIVRGWARAGLLPGDKDKFLSSIVHIAGCPDCGPVFRTAFGEARVHTMARVAANNPARGMGRRQLPTWLRWLPRAIRNPWAREVAAAVAALAIEEIGETVVSRFRGRARG